MEGYADDFFKKIEQACESKARNLSEHIYYGLSPTHDTEEAGIQRFTDFLKQLESKKPGESTARLIKWVRESIQDMRQMQEAREMSQKWLYE